LSWATTEIN